MPIFVKFGFFGFMILVFSFKFMVENRKLCEAPYNKTVDWARWYVFWADERVVAKSHADSNYKLARDGLLFKVCTLNYSSAVSFSQKIPFLNMLMGNGRHRFPFMSICCFSISSLHYFKNQMKGNE